MLSYKQYVLSALSVSPVPGNKYLLASLVTDRDRIGAPEPKRMMSVNQMMSAFPGASRYIVLQSFHTNHTGANYFTRYYRRDGSTWGRCLHTSLPGWYWYLSS